MFFGAAEVTGGFAPATRIFDNLKPKSTHRSAPQREPDKRSKPVGELSMQPIDCSRRETSHPAALPTDFETDRRYRVHP